ncbi:uncharacterized protein LOC100116797 isoform X1 [Nasonia vitripennis]|uniref:Transposase domain-containing protein n=1 Tax=Nasonia vitripennis TaxID=7425 RepID=A0A7M7IT91_NASVI|nr:uncharacterized protein LOC100116797 isoform X1 [Nasonia vitripennis]XP_031781197.1 uncharacterized protein LOC100116797 isoform X1 [Nasonia vitripennis]XP_031781198.1 uncharacterized protein LOC100116797 isoform X1 [Nasonia vitripennis]
MALKFALRIKLSHENLSHLMRLINCICGSEVLPQTGYSIDKLCNSKDNVVLYSVCPFCSTDIGKFLDLRKLVTCKSCNKIVDVSNPSNACYFAIIDPSEKIRDLIEPNEEYFDYIMNVRKHDKNHLRDIYDGLLYRQFVKSLPASDRHSYVTATINSDGAPVFESSNFSIWLLLYLMINELPVQTRFKNMCVMGLWFGVSKPEMSVFLEKFIESINRITTDGIECTVKDKPLTIKLFVLTACVDTVACAPMNGTSQFNAHFGCDWCEHEGVYYDGSMRYPYIIPPPPNRTRSSMIANAREALTRPKPVVGVKMASPLLNLQYFDIARGFTPEYMHCVLAGVTQQLTENIVNLLTPNQIDIMDSLLCEIKAPNQVCRLTRPLKDRGNWKAREWEN